MRFALFVFALSLVLPASLRAQTTSVWHTSLTEASGVAARSGQPLLIVFATSGNSADTFIGRLTSDPGFAFVASRSVLLRIDMPASRKIPSTDTEIQNTNAAVALRIDVLPTVVVADRMLNSKFKLAVTGQSPASIVAMLTQVLAP